MPLNSILFARIRTKNVLKRETFLIFLQQIPISTVVTGKIQKYTLMIVDNLCVKAEKRVLLGTQQEVSGYFLHWPWPGGELIMCLHRHGGCGKSSHKQPVWLKRKSWNARADFERGKA